MLTTNFLKIFIKFAFIWFCNVPASKYMFKVNSRNTSERWEICSKLTIKTPKRHYRGLCGVFIFNFEHISHIFLVHLLLTLNRSLFAGLFCKTSLEGQTLLFSEGDTGCSIADMHGNATYYKIVGKEYLFCWHLLKNLLVKLKKIKLT